MPAPKSPSKIMTLQMQGHGLRFADFNQAEFTIQLGPFRTREEVDLEELLRKLPKMVSIWSRTKCNHQEYQEIVPKWALCSVPQGACFPVSKISDLSLLQPQGWETRGAQSISPMIFQVVAPSLGNGRTPCPGKVLLPKRGCDLILVCPQLLRRN